ncbi:MAG TPA: sensor histidine kinase [Bacteroidia bacterium]
MRIQFVRTSAVVLVSLLFTNVKGQSLKDSTKVNDLNAECFNVVYKDPQKAKLIGFKALNLAQQIGYKKGESSAYSRLGIAYDVTNMYDSAMFCYDKALNISKSIGYKKGIGSAYCNIGLVYLNTNDYPKALNNFHSAIKPLEEAGEHAFLGNVYNNIGLLYNELDNYPKAIYNYKKAISEYEISKKTWMTGSVLSNLAMVYTETKKYDSAILIDSRAIAIFKEEEDYVNLSKSYNNSGLDYIMLKNYPQALSYFLKSLEYQEKIGSKPSKADTYGNIAYAYSLMGDDKNCDIYLEKAMKLAPDVSSKKQLFEMYFQYANIKHKQGDYKQSSYYFKQAIILKDSFFKKESSDLIAKAETNFGLERKEIENRQLQQKNRIQELELLNKQYQIRNRENITYLIVIASTILLVTIIFILRRRYKLLKKLEENKHRADQQKQRVEISHELHDNVGAQLAYIVSNLEVLENLHPNDKRIHSIRDMSKQAIVTLRETVWALNNETISITDFTDKFKQYTSKILDFNPDIHCSFENQVKIDRILQPIQALNLFRICQEAFSNAIHHSKAKNIHIIFTNDESTLFDIKIEDDGIGFDQEEASLKGHYGLITMRTRAGELGADFKIDSRKGEGTSVNFNLAESTH